MNFGDTHVHSVFSADCETPLEENIRAAIKAGLPWICFTDHIDYDYPPKDDMIFDFNIQDYFTAIREVKEKYKDEITVLIGVEIGMQPHLKKRNEDLIKAWPFDFCIGSQHLVYGGDPYYPETFGDRSDKEVYRKFFEETLENIKLFHTFDSLGHLDYIVRYGKEHRSYRYSDYADVLDAILKLLIKYNIALEVNTAGIRKKLRAPNPQTEVLKRYRDLGGTLVTIGSDSHRSYSIGFGFEQTAELLKSAGFTHIAYYVAHHPKFVLI